MWTTTARLHLLNVISRHGIHKAAYIRAYLRAYAAEPLKNWRQEYRSMLREYAACRSPGETLREYYRRKRVAVIDKIIERKREEQLRIIEKVLSAPDDSPEEESEDQARSLPQAEPAANPGQLRTKAEKAGEEKGDETGSQNENRAESGSKPGVKKKAECKDPTEMIATAFRCLPSLSVIHPQSDTPDTSAYSPEPPSSPIEDHEPYGTEEMLEKEKEGEQELEEILTRLENSGYGISISSVDTPVFERFFRWTLQRISFLEAKKREMAVTRVAESAEHSSKPENPSPFVFREYYALDFHEYPKKKAYRTRTRWVEEFPLVLSRVKNVKNGTIICEIHKTGSRKEEGRKSRKKVPCIRCFSATELEAELQRDGRPSMAEYVFRAMLFLQSVIFLHYDEVPPKEIEMVKNELYRFYEFYRK